MRRHQDSRKFRLDIPDLLRCRRIDTDFYPKSGTACTNKFRCICKCSTEDPSTSCQRTPSESHRRICKGLDPKFGWVGITAYRKHTCKARNPNDNLQCISWACNDTSMLSHPSSSPAHTSGATCRRTCTFASPSTDSLGSAALRCTCIYKRSDPKSNQLDKPGISGRGMNKS